MASNRLRQHKNILYTLKRNFGMQVTFKYPTQNDYDILTGAITRAYTEILVRRAIVLPTRMTRDFVYDLAYIASNKNFTHGGFFDTTTRNLIVQKSDLKGYTPTLEWACSFKNKEYAIKELSETEDSEGYVIICKHLDAEGDS